MYTNIYCTWILAHSGSTVLQTGMSPLASEPVCECALTLLVVVGSHQQCLSKIWGITILTKNNFFLFIIIPDINVPSDNSYQRCVAFFSLQTLLWKVNRTILVSSYSCISNHSNYITDEKPTFFQDKCTQNNWKKGRMIQNTCFSWEDNPMHPKHKLSKKSTTTRRK